MSVSSQRDSSWPARHRAPRAGRGSRRRADRAAALDEAKGLTPATACIVAAELTAHDALAAHVDAESARPGGADQPDHAAAAWHCVSAGRRAPADRDPASARGVAGPVTALVVLVALGPTGWVSAGSGAATPPCRAAGRHRRCRRLGDHLRHRPPVRRSHRMSRRSTPVAAEPPAHELPSVGATPPGIRGGAAAEAPDLLTAGPEHGRAGRQDERPQQGPVELGGGPGGHGDQPAVTCLQVAAGRLPGFSARSRAVRSSSWTSTQRGDRRRQAARRLPPSRADLGRRLSADGMRRCRTTRGSPCCAAPSPRTGR